jgi:hypothetical protein
MPQCEAQIPVQPGELDMLEGGRKGSCHLPNEVGFITIKKTSRLHYEDQSVNGVQEMWPIMQRFH